jgi:teichuronic acid biosynthesis glycosyltransferase TuaH
MRDRITVVILGTADWDQPIATNQHYLTNELAKDFDVRFVESIGLRRPELRIRDVRRMAGRLAKMVRRRSASGSRGRPRDHITVVTPFVLPLHSGLCARLNRHLLRRVIDRALAGASSTKILWTYSPVTYGVEERFDGFVYHCVDLLETVNGISAAVIDQAERHIAPLLDNSIATTDVVAESLRARGHKPVLWPNVADTATIEGSRPTTDTRAPGRVVFAGNLAPQKVDFALLSFLLKNNIDLHLAGPIAEGGGESGSQVEELIGLGATYHGAMSLLELSALYWSSCVGLIPYVINDYTRGVSPLKTYEYLAAGLSVVSTALPSVSEIEGHVAVASGPANFLAAVLRDTAPPSAADWAARSEIAKRNSWVGRGATARGMVHDLAAR